ncbi:hypothetical protein BGW42_004986 [Actinomortierella wolfii]|nr:hypothetical protein BGW42_004986 [Actinomortierella wolfii]
MASSHQFVEKSFTKLTYCDYCTKLLWGVAHQGMTCEGCGFICHHKCSKLVYNNCIRSMYIPGQDDNNKKKKSRRTVVTSKDSTAGSIPAAVVSSAQPLQTVPNRSTTASLTINTSASTASEEKSTTVAQEPEQKKEQQKEASLGFLEDAIISAAIRMSFPGDLSSMPKNDHPPLTIQTTTINFTRFVHRTTGLFWFQDRVEDIFTWKDPWNTMFVLVLYCFISILATIMVYFFQQKSMKQQQRILQVRGTNTTEGSSTIGIGNVQVLRRYMSDAESDSDDHPAGELDSATSSESEEDRQERQSLAVQYMSNLQHIQNMMGDISDAHDKLRPMLKHLDWSDETESIAIVQGCLAAGLGMSIAMWFIPWRQVFMVSGVTTMLANSPWGKIVLRELTPVVHEVVIWTRTYLANRNAKQ